MDLGTPCKPVIFGNHNAVVTITNMMSGFDDLPGIHIFDFPQMKYPRPAPRSKKKRIMNKWWKDVYKFNGYIWRKL